MGMHESDGIARLIHVLACAGMPAEISIYLLADHIRAEESCGGIKEMGRGEKRKRKKKKKDARCDYSWCAVASCFILSVTT